MALKNIIGLAVIRILLLVIVQDCRGEYELSLQYFQYAHVALWNSRCSLLFMNQ